MKKNQEHPIEQSYPCWQRIKLGTLLTDVAINARVSRRLSYAVLRSFLKVLPIYLKSKREVYLSEIGTFYLRKQTRYHSKDNSVRTYDIVIFRPSRLLKEFINDRKRQFPRKNPNANAIIISDSKQMKEVEENG